MQFTGHTLHFGDTIPGSNPFVLGPDDLSTHVGIFGRSGRGKSKLLEHLLRQVVNEWPASKGGCLVLDPHGPTYDGLLSYAAKLNVRRPIVPIDLRDPSWVVAYHLLRPRGRAKQSVVVDALIEAMLHAWGAADADATPLLARWSGNLFHALYAMRATLADAMELIVSPTTRRHVAEALGEHPAARDWHLAADAKGVEFEAMVSSTVNRLRRFVGNDTLRMMFGQGDGRPSFDFAEAVAEGWIVLVCLATEGSNVSRENSDLVGSLMLSDLWTSAADRGKRDRQRQYLVVADEFQRYLNPSIAEGLDQSRGFGLAWLLSCQYPRQTLFNGGEKGEHLLASLMENVGCKVIFQLTDEPNLGPLASWLFRGVFDPNRVKFDLHATRVVDYVEEIRESVTRSESTTETQSSSTTTQRSTSESSSENWLPDPEAEDYNVGEYGPATRGTSTTSIEGETNGTSTGETRGKSVSQQHMLRPILGTELAGRQFSGLDEQLFEATQMIFRLPPRVALARSGDMPGPVMIRIPTIESGAGRHYAQRFARRSGAQSHSSSPRPMRPNFSNRGKPTFAPGSTMSRAVAVPTIRRRRGVWFRRSRRSRDTLKGVPIAMPSTIVRPRRSPQARRHITDRDISVLRSLFDARILTVAHLANIHFAGSNEAARKRMMKLKADGWVTERPRERVFDPAILHLSRKGFSHLKQHGHLDDFPALGWETMEKRVQVSPLTLRHELSVGDVQAAFYRSVRAETRLRIAEFRTWPRLFSFTTMRTFPGGYTKPVTIRPDGYIKICRDEGAFGETEFYFYLEVDRSTETVGNIVRRLQGYATYYRTGGFAVAHGGTLDRPELYPFRVLVICRSEGRCRSIATAATDARPAIRNSAWFTTLKDLSASGAHQNVWKAAADFQDEDADTRVLVAEGAPDPLLHPAPDTTVPAAMPVCPIVPQAID